MYWEDNGNGWQGAAVYNITEDLDGSGSYTVFGSYYIHADGTPYERGAVGAWT